MTLMFLTLLFAALDTGLAYAHALELLPKMRYEPSVYLLLHRTLYWGYGTIGAVIDVAVVPLTIALAYKLRRDPVRSRPALIAAICYSLALILWVALISPANSEMRSWALDNPPQDWMAMRDRWEYSHLARFAIQLTGLSALIIATLMPTIAAHLLPRRMARPATTTKIPTIRWIQPHTVTSTSYK